jgi:hypothetical protein
MVANKKARKDKDKRSYKDSKDKEPKEKKEFKSEIKKKWQTKNQKQREKEMKEVERDMKEAEAEVDLEERAQVVSIPHRRMISADNVANGDTEEPIRAIFLDSQEPTKDSSPSNSLGRHNPLWPFHQYRILPRSPCCSSSDSGRRASTYPYRCSSDRRGRRNQGCSRRFRANPDSLIGYRHRL